MMKFFRFIYFIFSFFIEIEVEAEPFTKASVEKSISAEVMQKVSFTEFELCLDTWQSSWTNIIGDNNLNVIELTIAPDQKRFNAVVAWGDLNKGGVTKKINGKIQRFITVPVLNAPIAQQSPINESHLHYVRFPEDQVNQGMALRKEDLIGKMLKSGRALNLNKPLMMSDIEMPIAIRKGEQVRVKYIAPYFEISILAKAKTNGCVGDRIAFESSAKRIIQATVLHTGMAEIREQL